MEGFSDRVNSCDTIPFSFLWTVHYSAVPYFFPFESVTGTLTSLRPKECNIRNLYKMLSEQTKG
ncbi:hypothetical protein HMPREF9412_5196 [Paenibacillus sp. HGF5]|nr:hypothetical protein HMPREF9412_5196 [Paenibacillus sp. HGF5]